MKYKLKEKRKRNTSLYNFWLQHKDWTYKATGAVFHISAARAWLIIKDQRKLNEPR